MHAHTQVSPQKMVHFDVTTKSVPKPQPSEATMLEDSVSLPVAAGVARSGLAADQAGFCQVDNGAERGADAAVTAPDISAAGHGSRLAVARAAAGYHRSSHRREVKCTGPRLPTVGVAAATAVFLATLAPGSCCRT
jgi:hypothetical protein